MVFPAMFAHRYQLRSHLGSGGQGEVYEAFDLHEEETVALKVLRSALNPLGLWAEAAILRQLHDHHILPIRNADIHLGQPFLATALAAHGSIGDRISGSGTAGLTTDDTVGWIREACQGIARGHDRGLVHDDIKPANLFLNDKDECVVADWGYAARIDPATGRARVAGATAETVAPEVAATWGNSFATELSDVYSLGATAYWMLSGQPPVDLTGLVGAAARMRGAATHAPVRLHDVAPHVPRWVRDKVEKAMSPGPAARYDSAHAFAADLGSRPSLSRRWIRTDEHPGHIACWRGVPDHGATYVMCMEAGSTSARRNIVTRSALSGHRVTRGCASATRSTWPALVRRLITAIG
jgi:serine/threonine protein kinase